MGSENAHTISSGVEPLYIRSRNPFLGLVELYYLVFVLMAPSSICHARNWSIQPSLSIEGTYSDNINIAPEGRKDGDIVSEINTQFKAELKGRRVNADLNYRMQNLFYRTNSNDNTTFNQYLARANSELILKKLFVDINSALVQRNIGAGVPPTLKNYSITKNRTNQLTASIRPYWRQKLGAYAEGVVRYEYGIVDFDDDKVQDITSDSEFNDIFLSINSMPQDRSFSWTLGYNSQYIDFDDSTFDNIRLRRTGTILGYRILPGVRLLGLGGYEDNDFGHKTTLSQPRGSFWAAGFRWQPNTRNKLEARFGNRFFGDTYRLTWEQRSRYIKTELGYTEEIGDETKFLLEDTNLTNNSKPVKPFSLSLTADVFLRKRMFAMASLERSKTSIRISPYFEKRDFFNKDDENEQVVGVDASWEWAVAPRIALRLNLILERSEPRSQDRRSDHLSYIVIRASRQLSPKTTGFLQYSYTQFDSDNALIAYTENAFSLNLTRSF